MIISRVRTELEVSILIPLQYHVKEAGGRELAEQVRLNVEPAWMNLGGFAGVMVTSSGPSVERGSAT